MTFPLMHNIAALIKAADCYIHSLVAGAATDNVEKTGVAIDRLAYGNALSALITLQFTATLAAGKKLSLGYTVEHADDADFTVNKADFLDVAAADVATSVAGGTVVGVVQKAIDLAGAKRYVRLLFKGDLDAADTDTAVIAGMLVLGGQDTIPAQ